MRSSSATTTTTTTRGWIVSMRHPRGAIFNLQQQQQPLHTVRVHALDLKTYRKKSTVSITINIDSTYVQPYQYQVLKVRIERIQRICHVYTAAVLGCSDVWDLAFPARGHLGAYCCIPISLGYRMGPPSRNTPPEL